MAAFVATYPPLGTVTQLQDPSVTIHALLEVDAGLVNEQWQLSLWHSDGNAGEWTETEFTACSMEDRPTDLHEIDGARTRRYFTAKLTVQSSLGFTVKFRQRSDDGEWRWVRNEQGSDDGVVIIHQKPAKDHDNEDLPDMINELNPDLKWKSHMSQTPGTRLWSVEAGVGAAMEEESAYAEVPFGIPWGRYIR